MIFGKGYPDPRRIPYPVPQPLAYPPQLTTRDGSRQVPIHDHCAFINKRGDGATDNDAGHFHEIRGAVIQEAMGHTHRLTGLPCGAGAALVRLPHE